MPEMTLKSSSRLTAASIVGLVFVLWARPVMSQNITVAQTCYVHSVPVSGLTVTCRPASVAAAAAVDSLRSQTKALQDENAKLRKEFCLMRQMLATSIARLEDTGALKFSPSSTKGDSSSTPSAPSVTGLCQK